MTTARATVKSRPQFFDKPGFWALIVTQFQGAFSDNVYKLIIMLYLPMVIANPDFPVTAVSTALFNLPWLLIPALAGALADKYSKKQVTVATKILEIAVMSSGLVAVLLGNPWLLLFTLFMMALQSAFFSPAKYGILPEILPESKLSWGNGMLQMWTFVAIILGNLVGQKLLDTFAEQMYITMIIVVGFSAVGVCTSFFVTPAPPAEPSRRIPINPYRGMGGYLRIFWTDKRLWITLIGVSYFWFAGALLIQNVVELGKATEGLDVGVMMAVMALGIGIGSLMAGYVSRGKIEVGLVLPGLVLMGFMGLGISLPWISDTATFALLFALGLFGGFYDVPLAALLQERSPDDMKGGMIATLNFVTFSGMMVAAGLFWAAFNLIGLTPRHIFLLIAITSFLMSAYIYLREPVFLLRSVLWALNGPFLKLRLFGREHVPDKGGALFVSTHISFVDALVLLSSTDREIHFLMGKDVYDTPWMRRIARALNIIAVDRDGGPEALEDAAKQVREVIAQGHVACVNCERQMKKDGPETPWHRDYGVLVEGLDAPVIPIYMNRLWETLYVFEDNRIRWKRPDRLRVPVAVCYGAPLPSDTPGAELRQAVRALGVTWYMERKHPYRLVHHGFIQMARRRPRQRAIADAMTGELSYFKTFVASILFGRKLKKILGPEKMVGVLVPPTVGAALTNIALQLMGKVPINLNYTATPETMASCARRCGITQVLTSRRFLERLPLEVPGEAVFLEDIRETMKKKDQIFAMLTALFVPTRLIERSLGAPKRTEDDLATVIFSSGSEGEPKGALLTHRNIVSQTTTIAEVFPHNWYTRVVGFLPFFHSFGFTGTLWMPLANGVRSVYHPNPLEPRAIGKLTEEYAGTILVGTPTFLQGFIRRCASEQLKSLSFVMAGAEKLPERVRTAFAEKFGVEPMEAFGATECAPAVSVNLPDCESPGFYAREVKHGAIGKPLPGQMVRIVDPDTGAPMPVGESGLMLVNGPNIMQGYLEDPERTAAVLEDGWYATGDIAAVDDEGFITITDRLARFSKIAGEMIPHNRVEEALHSLLGATEQVVAVASAPDRVKGERLIVLHTLPEAELKALLEKLDAAGMPNLWRPRPNAFHRIDAIPVLGTGKMDIKAVKRIALELDAGE